MADRRPFDQKVRINALRLGALIVAPLLIFAHPYFMPDGLVYEVAEVAGVLLIIACVLGRFWSILYVGRHKNRSVVADGPYSMTRNPLYFFSALGAFGIGLLFGKVTLALLVGGGVFIALYLTARREAAFLAAEFGPAYAAYAARTPMFLPDPRLFRTEADILISSGALARNLRDAFVFLAAIPLAELAKALESRFDPLPFVIP